MSLTIINACFVKPLDYNMLDNIVDNYDNIITLEDNNIIGGFGNQVLLYLNKKGKNKNIKIIGFDDKFIDHGKVDELLSNENMSIDDIVNIIDN